MRVENPTPAAPVSRIAIVTLDSHLGAAVGRAQGALAREGVEVSLHAASEWAGLPSALDRCKDAVAKADVVIVAMMFLDEHIQAIKPTLEARRADCKAMVSIMSSAEVVKLTRLGKLDMSVEQTGPLALLKRLRGKPKPGGGGSSGVGQMKMLKRLPKILKWLPGKAQDLRAYFLTMQYFLAGSDENVANMARFLAGRYGGAKPAPVGDPLDYPEIGVYHPRLPTRMAEDDVDLPKGGENGTVGLLVMRSYVLSGDARHYDGAIAAFEARGLRVVPVFAAGLDARPAIDRFFIKDGKATVDAVVSLTGFSLVGGPAYNDSKAAEALLTRLDVPYIAAHALEFQTLEQWRDGARGLTPVEATIMVAIPEIDGATGPTVFGGRSGSADGVCHGCGRACDFSGGASSRDMNVCAERAERLALRVQKMIRLRRAARS